MSPSKRFKRPEEYSEEVGITAPTMIFKESSGRETQASWGTGNFFNPVKLVWAGLGENAPKGMVAPDYAYGLGEGAERIRDGCTMQPPEDFDWQNLSSGCHVIPWYEWDYLVGKWQETQNDAEEQEAQVAKIVIEIEDLPESTDINFRGDFPAADAKDKTGAQQTAVLISEMTQVAQMMASPIRKRQAV